MGCLRSACLQMLPTPTAQKCGGLADSTHIYSQTQTSKLRITCSWAHSRAHGNVHTHTSPYAHTRELGMRDASHHSYPT